MPPKSKFTPSSLVALAIAIVAILGLAATAPVMGLFAEDLPSVKMYRVPTCGCCGKWAAHLEAEGFEVEINEVEDTASIRSQNGVPSALGSCHTALVGDYVVEGHIPASSVKRLLEERPGVRGIAVPGMPIGSPGMEGPNAQPYRVFTFDDDGNISVFSTINP